MIRSEPDTSSSSGQTGRSAVKVDSGAKGARVTLTLPPDAKSTFSRKKVLERARRMLLAALEEERRMAAISADGKGAETRSPSRIPAGPRPGAGAWWMF